MNSALRITTRDPLIYSEQDIINITPGLTILVL